MRAALAFLLLLSSPVCARAETLVTVLSDSRGTGSVGFSFVPFLREYLPHVFVQNFSVAGRGLRQMEIDYPITIGKIKLKPTDEGFIFVLAGINDAQADASGDQIYDSLTALWRRAQEDHWRIVLFTDPCGPSLTAEKQRECARFNARILAGPRFWYALVRLDVMMSDHLSGNYVDGVHFSERGAHQVARIVSQALER